MGLLVWCRMVRFIAVFNFCLIARVLSLLVVGGQEFSLLGWVCFLVSCSPLLVVLGVLLLE